MKFKILFAALLIAFLGFFVIQIKDSKPMHADHPPQAVTVYKTLTCGCCANYVGYLGTKNYDVEVVDLEQSELDKKKNELGIPEELYSCHTTVASNGNYFVEGHIPYEAVDKLLREQPKIKGIGMPGMPHASPGMPGKKMEPFNISQASTNGAVTQYMSI